MQTGLAGAIFRTIPSQTALVEKFDTADVVIMAAAVADVRPNNASTAKISKDNLTELTLIENPDITKELSRNKSKQVMIGFAAQTSATEDEGLTIAANKLREKGLDFIYFNDVSGGAIFGSDRTEGVILSATGERFDFSAGSKMTLSNKLLDLALDKLGYPND